MADNIDPKNFAKAFADAVRLREEAQRTLDIIKDQTKYLQNQGTLRNEILSASKRLYEVTRDINDLDREDLGTLQAKKSIDKEIEKALKAQKDIENNILILAKDRSELSSNLRKNIEDQISTNKKKCNSFKRTSLFK